MSDNVFRPTRRKLLGLMGAALAWPGPGRADSLETLSGDAFGTTWRIVGQPDEGFESIRRDVEALFDGIDRQMSPWRPDSVVSRFNADPAGAYAADDELIHVTRSALSLAERSGGAFDPTVGPLVARWGFGPIEGDPEPDWRALSAGDGRIAKTRDDVTLDLCGIAKGRALDRAVGLAAAAGLDDLLFDLGGELSAVGRHPSGRSWRVAVEARMPAGDPPATLILPAGRSVATSGLRNQSYALAGHTYGHIIDPLTRSPVETGLNSVTVVADDAMTADGWATALFAAGGAAGPELAAERGITALFLVGNGSELRRIRTGGMEDLLL